MTNQARSQQFLVIARVRTKPARVPQQWRGSRAAGRGVMFFPPALETSAYSRNVLKFYKLSDSVLDTVLHPELSTLSTTPTTLNDKTPTLKLTPSTINPHTRNSTPRNLIPHPSTLTHHPSPIHPHNPKPQPPNPKLKP